LDGTVARAGAAPARGRDRRGRGKTRPSRYSVVMQQEKGEWRMAYRLFLSHTGVDSPLADALATNINNAFQGKIRVYVAKNDIPPGALWKPHILANLKESDGIISLLTRRSVGKPWLLIEWTAFWLHEPDKDIFILLTDDVSQSDLVSPMLDRQHGVVTNADHMGKFFTVLSQRAGLSMIPFAYIEPLMRDVNHALQTQWETECSRYKKDLDALPQDDQKKVAVAQFFLDHGDVGTFEKVLSVIRIDYLKVGFALSLIDRGEVQHLQMVSKHIRSPQNIGEIVFALIARDYQDVRIFAPHLDQIGYKDESEFTAVCLELAKTGKENTELFSSVVSRITNMSELRKVAMGLVDLGKQNAQVVTGILERLAERNRVELRKLGEHLIKMAVADQGQLAAILDLLRVRNMEQFQMLAKTTQETYPQFFAVYGKERGISA
jgi:hypothetical protein